MSVLYFVTFIKSRVLGFNKVKRKEKKYLQGEKCIFITFMHMKVGCAGLQAMSK